MKRPIFLFVFAAVFTISAKANSFLIVPGTAEKPSATLQRMWVDHNITNDGRYGMMMHVAFTVYNMKGTEGFLGFYFKYASGKPDDYIKHNRTGDQYHTKSGYLGLGKVLTPSYDASVYDDVEVFMPYDEFNLAPGTYDLIIDVQFLYNQGSTIAWLKLYDIEFTQYDKDRAAGNQNAKTKLRSAATTGPRASFEKMWVDYDIKQDGILGMMLHFKFITYDMQDTEALVAVYFEKNDGEWTVLKDKNQKFYSTGGDVAVYKDINPGYDTTYYDDLRIFMPYEELDLDPGKYELSMDTKLIHKQGGLISNFTYYDFSYTEPSK